MSLLRQPLTTDVLQRRWLHGTLPTFLYSLEKQCVLSNAVGFRNVAEQLTCAVAQEGVQVQTHPDSATPLSQHLSGSGPNHFRHELNSPRLPGEHWTEMRFVFPNQECFLVLQAHPITANVARHEYGKKSQIQNGYRQSHMETRQQAMRSGRMKTPWRRSITSCLVFFGFFKNIPPVFCGR